MYRVGIYSEDKVISNMLKELMLAKYPLIVYQYRVKNRIYQKMNNIDSLDIMIIDIQKSAESILLARNIQEKDKHVKIIFIASDIEEASNIFEAEPTYLLWKPLDKKKLYHAIDKAICKLEKNDAQMLKLHFKDKILCIPYQEIFYVESDRRYLIIHQEHETDKIMMKMSELMEMLPEYFVRCHQSYVVNVNKMMKFEKTEIVLEDGSSIAVSRNRLQWTRSVIKNCYETSRKKKR